MSKAQTKTRSSTEPAASSAPGLPPLFLGTTSSKIEPHHRERLAVVYVRQSTQQQVLENRESAALQYSLARRATELGWHAERVLVIDDDQGQSGRSAEGRLGFQRLLAEVGLNHVGLVLGIEMSRLARSCKDWHQLLELCALFHTLLADQDGLYDPTDFNDRLLLGLKGTMSEAELHILRGRMEQGRRNKARRGELHSHVPTGYVLLPSGEVDLDPDQQVQSVIRTIFDKFEHVGTIAGVTRYLQENQIRLGIRPTSGPDRGQLQWRRACRCTLRSVLTHPIYAGAYSYGRRVLDPRLQKPGQPKSGYRTVPREAWQALLRDHLPAYITWERYEANLQQIARNLARSLGVPRKGPSLLGGLVYCGRCGTRMVILSGKQGRSRYHCFLHSASFPPPTCQSLVAQPLDDLVSQQVLRVLEPAALELSLHAAADLQAERQRLQEHWQQELERAHYHTGRAARQYHTVEPENRLVARELEERWEKALCEERRVQEEYDRFLSVQPAPLSAHDRERIQSLASDIPALWEAPTTTVIDRQTIVRHLVERVVIQVQNGTEYVDVTIHWVGGFVSHHETIRPVRRFDQMRDFDHLLERIGRLREDSKTSGQIAEQLNAEGFRTPRGSPFNAAMLRHLLSRHGLAGAPSCVVDDTHLLVKDEWWTNDLAREIGIGRSTLMHWQSRGWVHARQLPGVKGKWIFWADAEELNRLHQLWACPRSWNDQPYPPELTTPKPRPKK